MAGPTSSVFQPPKKRLFRNIPLWSAFQDGPLQTSARKSDPQAWDAAGSIINVQSGSESDSGVNGPAMQRQEPFPHGDSDAAGGACSVALSTNRTITEDNAAGRSAFDAGSQRSTATTGTFEISETPSMTQKIRCPAHYSVVRVLGKRSVAERPRYLTLCWITPQEDEAANSDPSHHFRLYDKKISRDLAQFERRSTLRPRKHNPTGNDLNPSRCRKRPKTHVTVSTPQNLTFLSRQVEDDLFLDSDVHSVDLQLIQIEDLSSDRLINGPFPQRIP